jgi:hypothetical protein
MEIPPALGYSRFEDSKPRPYPYTRPIISPVQSNDLTQPEIQVSRQSFFRKLLGQGMNTGSIQVSPGGNNSEKTNDWALVMTATLTPAPTPTPTRTPSPPPRAPSR